MAGAIIIASAVGIVLLLLVGYVLVGSTLASGDNFVSAQKDMTSLKEKRLNTDIDITYADTDAFYYSPDHYHVYFRVKNTGNEQIDFTKMGVVIVMDNPDPPAYYRYGSGVNFEWNLEYFRPYSDCTGTESVNPGQWDPGEYLCGFIDRVPTTCGSWGCPPDILYTFTGNGVSNNQNIWS